MEKRENFSRKRMAILEALQGTTVHPTADWVFSQLKPKYPDLSLGTVYRNLKKFCETGKAASVGVINGQEHFDGLNRPERGALPRPSFRFTAGNDQESFSIPWRILARVSSLPRR